MRLVVLISGRGTNLEALLCAVDEGRCAAEIVGVIADREAPGLAHATRRSITTRVVPFRKSDRNAWARDLERAIGAFAPELIVLAGFMRVLSKDIVAAHRGRIINVHPALLPAFPGMHAPRQAVQAGVRVSGCTVHVVDEGVDTGTILAQAVVGVHPHDDADALQARIQAVEHRLLPAVVHAIAEGDLDPTTGTWRDIEASSSFFSFPVENP